MKNLRDNLVDLMNTLKTGDIVLYHGNMFVSEVIQAIQDNEWNHVGMIVETKDGIHIIESRISKIKGTDRNGVRFTPLSIKSFKNVGVEHIGIKRLKKPLTKEMLNKLHEWFKEASTKSYESDIVELIRSVWDGWGGKNKEDLDELFCSELVAENLQKIGLLSERKPSNEYTPEDCSKILRLCKGYSYGIPEKYLV